MLPATILVTAAVASVAALASPSGGGPVTLPLVSPRTGTLSKRAEDMVLKKTSPCVAVKVGTPPQDLLVQITLEGAPLVVASGCGGTCPAGSTLFNPASSSSYRKLDLNFTDLDIPNGASFEGTVANETVVVGGVTLTDLTILVGDRPGEIISLTSSELLGLGVSGIMGLGWEDELDIDHNLPTYHPWWRFLTPEAMFGIMLDPLPTDTETRSKNTQNSQLGRITFGGYDKAVVSGAITFVDRPMPGKLTETDKWLIPLDGIKVNGVSVPTPTYSPKTTNSRTVGAGGPIWMEPDLASDEIRLPLETVRAIGKLIPGASADIQKFEQLFVPCDTSAVVTFTFGGVDYDLKPSDWMYRTSYGQCKSYFEPGAEAGHHIFNSWTLGISFLQRFYTAFKYSPPQMGFGKLVSELPRPGPASSTTETVAAATDVSRPPPVQPGGDTQSGVPRKYELSTTIAALAFAVALSLV